MKYLGLAFKALFLLAMGVMVYFIAMDYFVEHPPADATFYGFFRYAGPVVGGFIAIIIALATSWAADGRQQELLEKQSSQKQKENEDIHKGLVNELQMNEKTIDAMLVDIRVELAKRAELTTENESFKRGIRKYVDRYNTFNLTRPIYENLGLRITQLPDHVTQAVISNESELMLLVGKLKEKLAKSDRVGANFTDDAESIERLLQKLSNALNKYHTAMDKREE